MSSNNSGENLRNDEPQPISDDALELATGGILKPGGTTNYNVNTTIYFQG